MSAWSCSFTKHELHLRVTAKCCKSFFLTLKTRFTPLQSFSCACKFYLRLQSYVHFHKSYHTHANLYDVKLTSYTSVEVPCEPYRYQNVTCKLCWSLIGLGKSSLLRHWTCHTRPSSTVVPARFKSAQLAKDRTQLLFKQTHIFASTAK